MKYIILNLKNFIFLVVILNLSIIFVQKLRILIAKNNQVQDWQLSLPVYKNYNWASEYYKDYKKLNFEFAPFTGFKNKSMSSNTINISMNGIRKSRNDSDSAQVLFLGASTIFGYGSNDFNTIPSIFSKLSDDSISVRNLGTNGFSVFQNFIKLNQYLFYQVNPEIVISFDGGLESFILLENQKFEMSHINADKFQKAFYKIPEHSYFEYLKSLIVPLQKVTIGVSKRLLNENVPIVSKSPQQLEIALNQYSLNMVNSWEQMLVLCNSKGIDFYCFYSPIFSESSFDKSNILIAGKIDKITEHRILIRKMLHKKVINLLQSERYASLSKRFVDLSKFLDSKQNVYIDPIGHFSPVGNELIANELIKHIYK